MIKGYSEVELALVDNLTFHAGHLTAGEVEHIIKDVAAASNGTIIFNRFPNSYFISWEIVVSFPTLNGGLVIPPVVMTFEYQTTVDKYNLVFTSEKNCIIMCAAHDTFNNIKSLSGKTRNMYVKVIEKIYIEANKRFKVVVDTKKL